MEAIETSVSHQTSMVLPESVRSKVWENLGFNEKWQAAEYAVLCLGIPPKLVPNRFEDKPEDIWVKLQNIAFMDSDISSVVLAGAVGVGKTSILSAMAKSQFCIYGDKNQHAPVQTIVSSYLQHVEFIHYHKLAESIRSALGNNADEDLQTLMDRLKNKRYLLIDDLMAGIVKEWDLVKLDEIIDYRWGQSLPTWITTNKSAKDLEQIQGFERSYSRLADKSWCAYYQIGGPDRRRTK